MLIWKYISSIGADEQLSYEEKRRIRLLTRLNVLAASVLLVYLLAQISLQIFSFFPMLISMMSFVIADFYLLKIKKYTAAKHFAMTTIMLSVSFFSLYAGDTYNEALFIPLIAIPLIIFQNKNISKIYFVVLILLIIIVKAIQPEVEPLLEITEFQTRVFKILNTAIAAAVTYAITFYFKSANEYYETRLLEMHDAVTEKNKEITDSIRYAKRIQQNLLTPEKYIERNLKKLKT